MKITPVAIPLACVLLALPTSALVANAPTSDLPPPLASTLTTSPDVMSVLVVVLEAMMVGKPSYLIIVPTLAQVFDEIKEYNAEALASEPPVPSVFLPSILLVPLPAVSDPSMPDDAAVVLGVLSLRTIETLSIIISYMPLAPAATSLGGPLMASYI